MSRVMKVMVALLAIAAFAAPAIAADGFSVYGSARTATYYVDTDSTDESEFDMDLLTSTSRFGLKASKGNVSGQFEMRTHGTAGSSTLRLMYGALKLDNGTFSVGQQYNAFTPASFSKLNVNDGGGLHWGFVGYTNREVSLKYAMNNGFTFAAVRNNTQSAGDSAVIPKLEASYTGKAGGFSYVAAAGYKNHVLNADDDFDCYLASFVGNVPAGPVALKFNVNYGVNAGEYGLGTVADAVEFDGSVDEDATILSGFVQGSIKANDSNLLSAGVLYALEESDNYAEDTSRMAIFVQDQITLAPGFTVSPEVVFFDYTDRFGVDGDDDEVLYVGAKWQINF